MFRDGLESMQHQLQHQERKHFGEFPTMYRPIVLVLFLVFSTATVSIKILDCSIAFNSRAFFKLYREAPPERSRQYSPAADYRGI